MLNATSDKSEPQVIIYTTASRDYDWWFTQDLGYVGNTTGKVPLAIRKVSIPVHHAEDQCGRYHSGFRMVADEAEWQKLVDYKLVEVA